ncbi:hypothetical protein [Cyanobium sp. NIES-981]|uniref:hypothetical protein n=1 Tax=Cyanobium sp. NIES-981 TaxID=1851505 RepID=UPI0007DDDDD5|nr:hypothetical protein [Cyanobium sp. NIES-981]SBO43776.1 conserved protein of unknown function [Cyanobium sp. NIES-981]
MPAPQLLMQATLARLGARLGSGLVDAAASLALVVQDAPERLRQELQLFWDEVELEADRLERGGGDGGGATARSSSAPTGPGAVQDQIDALRAQVAQLSRRLDRRP